MTSLFSHLNPLRWFFPRSETSPEFLSVMTTLKSIEPPFSFSTRENAAISLKGLREKRLILGDSEIERMQRIVELFSNPGIDAEIKKGRITTALIKPHAHHGKNLPGNDEDAAEFLKARIGKENILFSVPYLFTKDEAGQFYASVKERFSNVRPQGSPLSIWEGLEKFATSAPLTMLLLHRPKGKAVEWWRNTIGKTRPAEADPRSLRGKYALQENLPNNLFHGGDSPDSVLHEVNVLRTALKEALSNMKEARAALPPEEALASLGIIKPGEKFICAERIFDSGRHTEGWVYGYRFELMQPDCSARVQYVREKSEICFPADLARCAKNEYRRLNFLRGAGIPALPQYGVYGAAVYGDFVLENRGEEKVQIIAAASAEKLSKNIRLKDMLGQLVDMAAGLDRRGIEYKGFPHDLLFDADTNTFLLGDGGCDLIEGDGSPVKSNLLALEGAFPDKVDLIRQLYHDVSHEESMNKGEVL